MSTICSPFSALTPDFGRALRAARGRTGALAVAAGFPHATALNAFSQRPFRLTPLVAERLARLASLLGHRGPLVRELTPAELEAWTRSVALAATPPAPGPPRRFRRNADGTEAVVPPTPEEVAAFERRRGRR